MQMAHYKLTIIIIIIIINIIMPCVRSKTAELLLVPENSKPGDDVFVEGFPPRGPVTELKKKDWEKLQVMLVDETNTWS